MITLECNYSKKIGLPGYSSHQFSITLKTEINDVNQVQPESARLYSLLQNGVDSSIKEIGYLPGQDLGVSSSWVVLARLLPIRAGVAGGRLRLEFLNHKMS
jgi:hypothetical protein